MHLQSCYHHPLGMICSRVVITRLDFMKRPTILLEIPDEDTGYDALDNLRIWDVCDASVGPIEVMLPDSSLPPLVIDGLVLWYVEKSDATNTLDGSSYVHNFGNPTDEQILDRIDHPGKQRDADKS
ncbi:hypothetical protein ACHQM5_007373 [Ranunculus cassubicifolius]